jgi:hypothetical protein
MTQETSIRAGSLKAALLAIEADTLARREPVTATGASIPSASQRRRRPRIPVQGTVRLVLRGQVHECRVGDVSACGMQLEDLGADCRPDEEMVLLDVQQGSHSFDMLGLRCRVVWVRGGEDGSEARVGLHLRPAAEAQKNILSALLNACVERHADGMQWDEQLGAAVPAPVGSPRDCAAPAHPLGVGRAWNTAQRKRRSK